ncbi:MAG: PKD domain-containing protein, partial [Deltaproteobacteria bacterium]|nr:PKD domain-containing protein [Deltaproteobacteria bacterium]
QFSNQSDGPVAIYAWDFGDGSTSDERDPAHTYIAAGTYSVTLTVSGAGCSDMQTKSNMVLVDPLWPGSTPICPLTESLAGMPCSGEHAQVLRDFRDRQLSTSLTGKLLTGLYYASAEDVNSVIDQDDELKTEIGSLVTGLALRVKAVADGNTTAITQAELNRIKDVLNCLSDNGGAVMKMTVQFVLNKIDNEAFLQQYGIFIIGDVNN